MSYFYDYMGEDQDLLVESDEPRPDLLEWAYWREITAEEASRTAHVARPEPTPVAGPAPELVDAGDSMPGEQVVSEPAAEVKKPAPRKATAKKAA